MVAEEEITYLNVINSEQPRTTRPLFVDSDPRYLKLGTLDCIPIWKVEICFLFFS